MRTSLESELPYSSTVTNEDPGKQVEDPGVGEPVGSRVGALEGDFDGVDLLGDEEGWDFEGDTLGDWLGFWVVMGDFVGVSELGDADGEWLGGFV